MTKIRAVADGAGDGLDIGAAFRSWLTAAWDPALPLLEWRRKLVASGWARPSWPIEWCGKGVAPEAEEIVSDELDRAGAVGTPVSGATKLASATILQHGPDHVRARFLRPLLTGEESWCQLFSEPGAGSDLAGLTTSAVRDGNRWILNGQKLWTTSAQHADLGMCLARTHFDVPKHHGITFFLLPMRQPGVEVRPLRQMNGHCSFNEVFLTNAEVPDDHVVGEVGGGWLVAMTTLSHERKLGALVRPAFDRRAGRTLAEAADEVDDYFETYKWYPQRAGRVDLALELAARAAPSGLVRQELVRLVVLQRVAQWTAARARTAIDRGGRAGPEGSIGKLALSGIARQANRVHTLLAGPSGMLAEGDAPHGGVVAEVLVSTPAQSIAGGTDEIQRNIIGDRVLGLPREPDDDRERPFRQSARGEKRRAACDQCLTG